MNTHTQIILPQETETPVTFRDDGVFYTRYAYARSADSAKNQDKGQDFLTFWISDSRIAFALCDGVSQSFYGDLAARLLGNRLLEILTTLDLAQNETRLLSIISNELQTLTTTASSAVSQLKLPDHISPLIAGVLEKKRQIGSESTFVAGAIDLTQGYACFFWMGDSRLRLFSNEREVTNQLGETFQTQERWSTRKGLVGNLHLYRTPATTLTHFAAYSDGFSYLDRAMLNRAQRPFSNRAIQQFIVDAAKMPSSDDISFLEVWLQNAPRFPRQEPVSPPFLQDSSIKRENKGITVHWQSLPNVSEYEIRLCSQNGSTITSIKTTAPEWRSIELDPQVYAIEIRCWHDGEPGLWSDPVTLSNAAPVSLPAQPPMRDSVTPKPSFQPPPSPKPQPSNFPTSTPQPQKEAVVGPRQPEPRPTPTPTTTPNSLPQKSTPARERWGTWLVGGITLTMLVCISIAFFTIAALRSGDATPTMTAQTPTMRITRTVMPVATVNTIISPTLTISITPTTTLTTGPVTATVFFSSTPDVNTTLTPTPLPTTMIDSTPTALISATLSTSPISTFAAP